MLSAVRRVPALLAALALLSPARAAAQRASVAPDTLAITRLAAPPALDGRASAGEYGAPALRIATAQGEALVWLAAADSSVYVAAVIPDSSVSWRDAFTLSLDPLGDRTPQPGHDDTQWVVQRVADSSVVNRGVHGRWMPPNGDPDWRVGRALDAENYAFRVASSATGWSVELRLDRGWFAGEAGHGAALAVTLYDDRPHGWRSWPPPAEGQRATEVERQPPRWAWVAPLR